MIKNTICTYIGVKQPNIIVNRYAEYFTAGSSAVNKLEQFGADYIALEDVFTGPKGMNLLILGAGSQGPVVKGIAEASALFHQGFRLESFVHVGSGVTVAKNAVISAYFRVGSGTVVWAESAS